MLMQADKRGRRHSTMLSGPISRIDPSSKRKGDSEKDKEREKESRSKSKQQASGGKKTKET